MKCFLLSIWVLLPCMLPAQDTLTISLDKCMERVLSHNLDIKIANATSRKNQYAVKQAKWSRLPALTLSNDAYYRLGKSINLYTNQFESVPVSSSSAYVSSNFLLYQGFQSHNQIQQQKKIAEASQLSYHATAEETMEKVLRRYFEILVLDELIKITVAQMATTVQQLSRVKELVIHGQMLQQETLKLLAQQASEQFNQKKLEAERRNAVLDLLLVLQMTDAKGPIKLLPVPLDNPKKTLAQQPKLSEQAFGQMVAGQYKVKESQKRIEASKHQLRFARGYLAPRISLSAGVSTNYSSIAPNMIPKRGAPGLFEANTINNQLQNNLQQYVGGTLSVPISNFYQQKGQIQMARIDYVIQEDLYMKRQQEASQLLQKLQSDIDLLAEQIQYKMREANLAMEMERMGKEQWLEGDIHYIEYLQYKNKLQSDQYALVQLQHQLQLNNTLFRLFVTHSLSAQ